MQHAGDFTEMRLPFVSNIDQTTSPIPSIFKSLAIPLTEAPLGSFFRLPGRKSLSSGLTHCDAPESQITEKLSFGSMAALQATRCWRTTASENGHSDFLGDAAGVPVDVPVGVTTGVGLAAGRTPEISQFWMPVGVIFDESLGELSEPSVGVSVGVALVGSLGDSM